MGNGTRRGNSKISSNPSDPLATIHCFDPQHLDQICPICEGIGIISYDVEIHDPRFGKLYRCPNNPIDADADHKNRLLRLSNLDAFADVRFDTFEVDPPGYTPKELETLRVAYEVCTRYAANPTGWILLQGSYGCGKTHLAAAIGNFRLDQGDPVLFVTAPDLLDHLRGGYSSTAEVGYDETFARVKDAPLLIIDDLGVENPSPWAKEKLFQVLNHRYNYQIPTVITSNANIDDLDPRLRSRLIDLEIVERVNVSAPDYRSMTSNNQNQLLSRLHLYRHMSFETFNIDDRVSAEEHENLGKALQLAAQYAENPQGWLMYTGMYGSGKTHLAAAIANTQEALGQQVMFLTVPDLLDYLRTAYAPNSSVTFDRRFADVRNVPLLVLDDMGTESATGWAKEKLFQVLDYRYVAELPTVITTSQRPNDVDKRIQSRIFDQRMCRVFAITSEGYALRMKRPR